MQFFANVINNMDKINFLEKRKTNSIELCRINIKNTNFVSKIISNDISPVRPVSKNNSIIVDKDMNKCLFIAGKNSFESIFNLIIMNRNEKDKKTKNDRFLIFKNDNINRYNNNCGFINEKKIRNFYF